MPLYVRKSSPVHAVQWTGHNVDEIREFMGSIAFSGCVIDADRTLHITTVSGTATCQPRDYLVEETLYRGRFYPVPRDHFEAMHEKA